MMYPGLPQNLTLIEKISRLEESTDTPEVRVLIDALKQRVATAPSGSNMEDFRQDYERIQHAKLQSLLATMGALDLLKERDLEEMYHQSLAFVSGPSRVSSFESQYQRLSVKFKTFQDYNADYGNQLASQLRDAILQANVSDVYRILAIRTSHGRYCVNLHDQVRSLPKPLEHAVSIALQEARDPALSPRRAQIVQMLLDAHSRPEMPRFQTGADGKNEWFEPPKDGLTSFEKSEYENLQRTSADLMKVFFEGGRESLARTRMRECLLEKIINCRNRLGSTCFDLKKGVKGSFGITPLLWKAALQEDAVSLAMFLDVRDRDNHTLLDVNERHQPAGSRSSTTLLDELDKASQRKTVSQEILDLIYIAGGVHASELEKPEHELRALIEGRQREAQTRQAERLREQEAAHQAEQAARLEEERRMQEVQAEAFLGAMAEGAARAGGADDVARDAEREALVAEFAGSAQNTHDSVVTQSVSTSVGKLKRRYPHVAIEETIQEVLRFLESLGGGLNKRTALQCVERISSISIPHQASGGTTLRHVLALVWHGIEDRHALPEGVTTPLTDKDIVDRKHQLMLQLHEAQTEDPSGGPLCFMGTFNKIVETLNRMHPDVLIIEGAANIVSALGDRAKILLRDFLREKPVADQKLILSGWDELDDNPSLAEQAANAFREEAIKKIQAELAKEYSSLLTPAQYQEISTYLEEVERPVLHAKLDRLLKTIRSMRASDIPAVQDLIAALKGRAAHAYDLSSQSFEDVYQSLLKAHEHFQAQRLHMLSRVIKEMKASDFPGDQALVKALQDQTTSSSGKPVDEQYQLLLQAYQHTQGQRLGVLLGIIWEIVDSENEALKRELAELHRLARHTQGDFEVHNGCAARKYPMLLSAYESFQFKKLNTEIQAIQRSGIPSIDALTEMFQRDADALSQDSERTPHERYQMLLEQYETFQGDRLTALVQVIHAIQPPGIERINILTEMLQRDAEDLSQSSSCAHERYQMLLEQYETFQGDRLTALAQVIQAIQRSGIPSIDALTEMFQRVADALTQDSECTPHERYQMLLEQYETFQGDRLIALAQVIRAIQSSGIESIDALTETLQRDADALTQDSERTPHERYQMLLEQYETFQGDRLTALAQVIHAIQPPGIERINILMGMLQRDAEALNQDSERAPHERYQMLLKCYKQFQAEVHKALLTHIHSIQPSKENDIQRLIDELKKNADEWRYAPGEEQNPQNYARLLRLYETYQRAVIRFQGTLALRNITKKIDEKIKIKRAGILAPLDAEVLHAPGSAGGVNALTADAFREAAKGVYNTLVTAHQKNGALGLFGTWKAERDLIEQLDAALNDRAPTYKATDTAMVFRFLFELLYQVFQKIVDIVLPSQRPQIVPQQS